MQKAAAERFDSVFKGFANENPDPYVSKMLADGEDSEYKPRRT